MTNEEYLKKVITFEDGKLLCDGIEISIEEAEKIIKIQSRAMEETVYDYIQKNPDLGREEIASLSDTVIETQMRVAQSKIDVKDLDEYQDIRQDIAKAEEICDRALKLFAFKNKKVEKKEKKEKSTIIWKYQPADEDEYEPSPDEMVETGYDLLIKQIIILEFKKQFATADIDLISDEIEIYGNFADEFLIYIYHKDLEIYFQINENQQQFDGLKGNYIGSGLRINSMLIQTSLDAYSKKSSHTVKTAFSFDNIITMQIRFLKNTIKQEINYSLSKSIAKAEDRYAIAKFFMINFNLLMDKKTKKKLNNIMSKSTITIEDNQKDKINNQSEIVSIENKVEKQVEKIKEKAEIENYIKNEISLVFSIKEEQIKIDKKEVKKDKIFDIQVSGQRIILSYLESEVMLVSSTNTLGTGKNDIQNLEIKGEDVYDKIRKAVLASYSPMLNRQIENMFTNIRGKQNKKVAKSLETSLKEIVYDMLETKISNKDFKEKIDFIINELLRIDSISYEIVFELIDKVFANHFSNIFKNKKIYIHDNEFLPYSLFDVSKATLFKYKSAEESGDSLVERFENVQKYIKRLLALTETIKLIQEYKDIKFNFEYTIDQIENSIEKENELRRIADDLSEDNIIGGSSRKLLSLMDISISSKDQMFKFNLDEILAELSQANL